MDITTNRGEFNRAYKASLQKKSKIHCSYCGYHSNENYEGKHYGGIVMNDLIMPSWKLVSKNRKQWMNKPIKKNIRRYGGNTYTYIDITW